MDKENNYLRKIHQVITIFEVFLNSIKLYFWILKNRKDNLCNSCYKIKSPSNIEMLSTFTLNWWNWKDREIIVNKWQSESKYVGKQHFFHKWSTDFILNVNLWLDCRLIKKVFGSMFELISKLINKWEHLISSFSENIIRYSVKRLFFLWSL